MSEGKKRNEGGKQNESRKRNSGKQNESRKQKNIESCKGGNPKTLDDEALEKLLAEQMRKQVRSDYRRSLGREHQRRYLE